MILVELCKIGLIFKCYKCCKYRIQYIYTFLYRVVGNWRYKRKGGDSTRKKKSKIQNKNFSFEALFSRKSILNFRSVRVHFITSRYNGSHCRSLYRANIQSRFSRKQSLKRKIFILHFRLLFLCRITPFPIVQTTLYISYDSYTS